MPENKDHCPIVVVVRVRVRFDAGANDESWSLSGRLLKSTVDVVVVVMLEGLFPTKMAFGRHVDFGKQERPETAVKANTPSLLEVQQQTHHQKTNRIDAGML